jgi:hypothetical protein
MRTLRWFQFDPEREIDQSGRDGIGGGERRRFTFNGRRIICSLVLNVEGGKSYETLRAEFVA